jgi:hypothetical protein
MRGSLLFSFGTEKIRPPCAGESASLREEADPCKKVLAEWFFGHSERKEIFLLARHVMVLIFICWSPPVFGWAQIMPTFAPRWCSATKSGGNSPCFLFLLGLFVGDFTGFPSG